MVLKEVQSPINLLNAQAEIPTFSNVTEKWLNIANIRMMPLFNAPTSTTMMKLNPIKVTLEWLMKKVKQLTVKEVESNCGDQIVNGVPFVTKQQLMLKLSLCVNKWVSPEVNYTDKKDKKLVVTIKEKIFADPENQLTPKWQLVLETKNLSLNVTSITLLQIVLMMRMLLLNVLEIQEIHQELVKKITMKQLFHHLSENYHLCQLLLLNVIHKLDGTFSEVTTDPFGLSVAQSIVLVLPTVFMVLLSILTNLQSVKLLFIQELSKTPSEV